MQFRFTMLAAAAALAFAGGSALAQSTDVAKPAARPAATKPVAKTAVQPTAASKSVHDASKAKAETAGRAVPADMKSGGCHSKGNAEDA